MMGKFDVLEPCGALENKKACTCCAVWRAVKVRGGDHDQSVYPSRANAVVIRGPREEEDADR